MDGVAAMGMTAFALSNTTRLVFLTIAIALVIWVVITFLRTQLGGFGVTLKQMTPGRRVTTQYPEEKRVKPQRFHGRHVLNRYPDGVEKCIGCELCAGVCPARCIYVRGQDNDLDDPYSPGERTGWTYEINMLRCIFCGLCVEACPTEAITMTHLFEMSVDNRADAIYTLKQLLMEKDGTVPHPQPDSILVDKGELLEADGWMRATAPSGRAEYEGIQAWTPTLGAGHRPAEQGQSSGQGEDSGWQAVGADERTGDGGAESGDDA